MALYMGLDIGGTNLKGMIADESGTVTCEDSVPTQGGEKLADCAADLAKKLVADAGLTLDDIAAIGIGCPGMIDSAGGNVVFAGNLHLKNYPLARLVSEKLGKGVKIANDAHTAALGEARFGAGRDFKNCVLVQIGTGVGGGVIINGELYEGAYSVGTEIGHMVIERGGLQCTCGRRGCFERYASAKALGEYTQKAMEEDTGSAMWNTYTEKTATAKTPFEYMDTDTTAKKVVDAYLKNLACGCVNLANIFRPDVIMISGAIAAQGERLTKPLQELVNKELFGGTSYAPAMIVIASLGPKAGMFGAVALAMKV